MAANKRRTATRVRPVSKKDAADQKGVTKGAVSLACRLGGALHAALLDTGRLNSAHPAYEAWIAGRRGQPHTDDAPTGKLEGAKSAPTVPTKSVKPGQKKVGKPTAEGPEAAQSASSEAIKEPAPRVPTDDELTGLLQTFGTHRNLSDSLKLRKSYVDLCEKELRLKEAKGQLIKREILVTIVACFDQAFHQLLTDLPKTASREIYAMARNGSPLEAAEQKHKELVSSHLTAAKEEVRRKLRAAHGPATNEFPRPA